MTNEGYVCEAAICLSLHDPHRILDDLKVKTKPYPIQLKQATINKFAWEISFSLFVAKKAVVCGDVVYAAGCCFRSVACMNQVVFALNEEYLLNEKGAVAVANSFALCPRNYQQQVESVFALLAVDAKTIMDAIASLKRLSRI